MPADSEVQAVGQAVTRLREILQEALPKLTALDEARSAERPRGMRWSRKEILGHLVDSAGNNHQRFVRAQLEAETTFPPYVGDRWLAVQGYACVDHLEHHLGQILEGVE